MNCIPLFIGCGLSWVLGIKLESRELTAAGIVLFWIALGVLL